MEGGRRKNRTDGAWAEQKSKKCRDKTAIHFNAGNGLVGIGNFFSLSLPTSSLVSCRVVSRLSLDNSSSTASRLKIGVTPMLLCSRALHLVVARHRQPPVLAAIPGTIYRH